MALVPQVLVNIDALDESPAKHRLDLLGVEARHYSRVSKYDTGINLTGSPHPRQEIAKNSFETMAIPAGTSLGATLKDF